MFREQGSGVRYLEIFQRDYDSLKTAAESLSKILHTTKACLRFFRLLPPVGTLFFIGLIEAALEASS